MATARDPGGDFGCGVLVSFLAEVLDRLLRLSVASIGGLLIPLAGLAVILVKQACLQYCKQACL